MQGHNNDKKEKVIGLAAKVARLREELVRTEAELARLLEAASPDAPKPSRSGGPHGIDLVERFLYDHPHESFAAQEIAERLDEDGYFVDVDSIRAMLNRLLHKKRTIARGERGRYQAIIPGAPKVENLNGHLNGSQNLVHEVTAP